MGTLTKADFISRVLLSLNNISTAHPVIAANMHITAINNAPNRLIRENPDMFPEHHNRSWTIGPTLVPDMAADPVVEGNRITLPDNLLELHKVYRNDSDTDPESWQATQGIIVAMPQNAVRVIELSDKTVTGFPQICGRKDSDLIYWPTTSADYECYFHLYGISRESELDDDTDTFLMDRDFDQVIVLLAASETAEAMGWTEKAMELLTAAGTRMKERGGVLARERARMGGRIRIAGMPG